MKQSETERMLVDLISDRIEERINRGIIKQQLKRNTTLRILYLEPAGIEITAHDGILFLRFLPHTSAGELARISQLIAPGERWEYSPYCLTIPVKNMIELITTGGWEK